uniref:Uncharacterized protein n=1 Tax=Babesia bovis TaxID=5865 RepID=S6BKL4_BABBO|nr:hypothetical protein [Babesia bovis]
MLAMDIIFKLLSSYFCYIMRTVLRCVYHSTITKRISHLYNMNTVNVKYSQKILVSICCFMLPHLCLRKFYLSASEILHCESSHCSSIIKCAV